MPNRTPHGTPHGSPEGSDVVASGTDAWGDPGTGAPTGPAVEPPPPPTPFERAAARRRGRRRRALVAAVGLLALAAGAALLVRSGILVGPSDPVADAGDPGAAAEGATPGPVAEDPVLLDLLRAIDRSENAMLDFSDAIAAALGAATSQEEGLRAIAAAATEALGELEAERVGLDVGLDDGTAEEVRAAYLPHLDAWIVHFEQVAADPEQYFAGGADPAILRINATARVFALALSAALDAGVGPAAEELGRGILERGFPLQDDAQL